MVEKDYRFAGGVKAAPHQAGLIRIIVREALEAAGYELTTGVTTVERSHLQAMAIPPGPFNDSHGVAEAEHSGKLRKRMGRGPQS